MKGDSTAAADPVRRPPLDNGLVAELLEPPAIPVGSMRERKAGIRSIALGRVNSVVTAWLQAGGGEVAALNAAWRAAQICDAAEQAAALAGADPVAVHGQPQTTHWDGCWRAHHGCAVARLEQLADALLDLAAEFRLTGLVLGDDVPRVRAGFVPVAKVDRCRRLAEQTRPAVTG